MVSSKQKNPVKEKSLSLLPWTFTSARESKRQEYFDVYNKGISKIKFDVEINGNDYEIILEKNDTGAFSVSSLTALEK